METIKQPNQMNNQKININNEAARLGYFGQPVESLINYVKQIRKNHYKDKISQLKKNIELSDTSLKGTISQYNNLEETVKKGSFTPSAVFLFGASIVLMVFFLIFDIKLSIISLPVMTTACFAGSLLHHFNLSKSNLHKTIFFAALGFFGMVVMTISLLRSDYSFFTAFPIGLFSGLCIYLMNISFQTIFENFIFQVKYVSSVYRKWMCNKKMTALNLEVHSLNGELQQLLANIEQKLDEDTYNIQYEYELGMLARTVQTNQTDLFNINNITKEDFSYVA